jgi:alanine dehydrogenase
MPPKVYLKFLKHNGDLRTMPSFLERQGVSSVKIVSSHPDNAKNFGLPTVMATILLVEPKNGQLLAIIGGRTITAMRTGAASGIAAKYLAKKNPRTVGFIGTGVQARSQLSALMSVFPSLQEIKAWDMLSTAKEAFVAETKNKWNQLKIVSANTAKDAVTEIRYCRNNNPFH